MSARMRRSLAILVMAMVPVAATVGFAPAAQAAARLATLQVTYLPVAPGLTEVVGTQIGDGTCSGDYTLTWDGAQISATATVTNAGSHLLQVSLQYVVPINAGRGAHTLVARCRDFESPDIVTLDTGQTFVVGASLSAASGLPGSQFTVEGDYVPAPCVQATRLIIQWDADTLPWSGLDSSTYQVSANAITYNFGRFSVKTRVPADAAAGPHPVTMACANPPGAPMRWWSATFTVQQPAPTPPPPPTAHTPPQAGGDPTVTSDPPTSIGTSTPVESLPEPPSQSPSSSPSPGPASPVGGDRGGWPRPKQVAAIPRAADLHPDPVAVAWNFLLVLVLAFLLLGWPAELFNKTYEENEATIRRWLRLRPVPSRSARRSTWPVVVGFSVVAAALMSIAEPATPDDRKVIATALALLIAVPVVSLAYGFAAESYVRRAAPSQPRAALRVVIPALLVAVGLAVVSRVGNFVPEYVYGLVLTYTVVGGRRLTRRQEGLAILRAVTVLVLVGAVAWCAWQFGTRSVAQGADTPMGLRVLDTTLAYVAMLSLESLVIGLLPLRFLDGEKLWRVTWTVGRRERRWPGRLLWTVTFAVVVTAFRVVLGDLGERTISVSDLRTMAELAIGFAAGSLAFWAFFNARRLGQEAAGRGAIR